MQSNPAYFVDFSRYKKRRYHLCGILLFVISQFADLKFWIYRFLKNLESQLMVKIMNENRFCKHM